MLKDIIGSKLLVGREYKPKALLSIALFFIAQGLNLNAPDYLDWGLTTLAYPR